MFCWCPQIEHLYGLTVFENYLYATNSDEGNLNPKTSVIRVNRFNSSDFQVVTRVDRGAALHVYHQRRQPQGTSPPTPQLGEASFFFSSVLSLFPVADAGASSLSGSVRSHACATDQFGKAGGCSDICLLSNSHKTRTCRCRSGFSLGSDGKSCKSECSRQRERLRWKLANSSFKSVFLLLLLLFQNRTTSCFWCTGRAVLGSSGGWT